LNVRHRPSAVSAAAGPATPEAALSMSKIRTGRHVLCFTLFPASRCGSPREAQEANMPACPTPAEMLDPRSRAFYRRVMETLDRSDVPFLVGGAFALAQYTGIIRVTKDFDI